jgi:hypothetical protein
MRDSMDEQNKEVSEETEYMWVIWKTTDKWSTSLQASAFHQLLHIHQETQDECWGFKFKGW